MVDIGEPFVSGTPQRRPDDRAGLYNIAPHAKAKPGLPPDRARARGGARYTYANTRTWRSKWPCDLWH